MGEIFQFDSRWQQSKDSARAFLEPNDFYRAWFEQVPMACFSITTDRMVRAVNGWALRLLGYERDQLLGRSVFDLYANSLMGKSKAQAIFFRFLEGVEILGEKLQMQCADGSSLWISLTARPIRAANGQIVASCSIVEEILRDPITSRAGCEVSTPPNFSLACRDSKPDLHQETRWIIKSAHGLRFLNVEEIDWIEAAGNYAQLHAGNRLHLVRETMNRLEARLCPFQFIRVHRRVIVNVTRLKRLEPCASGDYGITLFDGTRLTLSRTYRKRLKGVWLS